MSQIIEAEHTNVGVIIVLSFFNFHFILIENYFQNCKNEKHSSFKCFSYGEEHYSFKYKRRTLSVTVLVLRSLF